MPAEWAPHRGTWLSWPHKEASWPGIFDRIPKQYAHMAATLARHEDVFINVRDRDMESDARDLLLASGAPPDRLHFFPFPTDDAWCRDHGPVFVHRPGGDRVQEAVVDWDFNAWGGKYPPWNRDNAIPQRVADHFSLERLTPGLVLEGGSIDVNGAGLLLTTEACLLDAGRNPGLGREDIESALERYLGIESVLWLGDGVVGDDTDGHVDDVSRFVDPVTVVTATEEDPQDDNHGPLQDNLDRLRAMRGPDGSPLRIVELPMPSPVFHDGERLPASYANFYIANGVVLLPSYDLESDARARAVLQPLFPGRDIVPIASTDLVWGLGSCHCLTQQWPALP